MSSFTVLLLFIQACLVQNVFSSCVDPGLAPPALAPAPCAGALNANYGLRSPAAAIASPCLSYGGDIGSAYGGAGEGNVAVAGELPVAGKTAVTGQVPITGAVSFGGVLPAIGTVIISGRCTCDCGY